jgi:apolipoprotein N-acyltransferase
MAHGPPQPADPSADGRPDQPEAAGPPATSAAAADAPANADAPARRWVWPVLLAAVGSGACLRLAHFPFSLAELAWVALVPWLLLVEARTRGRLLASYLAGLVYFVWATQWVRVADPRMVVTWLALGVYCAGYWWAATWLIGRLRRGWLPWVVAVPAVWVGLEYLRAHALTGFGWYFLAHTQHANLPLIQIADLGGAYAVSFVLASVNALALVWLLRVGPVRRWFGQPSPGERDRPGLPWLSTVWVVALVAGTLGYGEHRLGQEQFTPGPRVALLQPSIDQRISAGRDPGEVNPAQTSQRGQVVQLNEQALALDPLPDLIVWPETCYPDDWYRLAPDVPLEWLSPQDREVLRRCAAWPEIAASKWRTNALLGLNTYVFGANGLQTRYNSALLLRKDGTVGGRYDKFHPVPFGEYLPFRQTIPLMRLLSPYDFDYSIEAGTHPTRFPLDMPDGTRYFFGVIICYEDTDPPLARQYLRAETGPPVDFLVNITNDGWFNGTEEHEEHLAICRFRAVECRRSVIRSANMGISAIIDGSGRVVALPGPSWAESKRIATVLTDTVPIDRRHAIYPHWGDWLGQAAWLVVAVGLVGGFVRDWRERRHRRQLVAGA